MRQSLLGGTSNRPPTLYFFFLMSLWLHLKQCFSIVKEHRQDFQSLHVIPDVPQLAAAAWRIAVNSASTQRSRIPFIFSAGPSVRQGVSMTEHFRGN